MLSILRPGNVKSPEYRQEGRAGERVGAEEAVEGQVKLTCGSPGSPSQPIQAVGVVA